MKKILFCFQALLIGSLLTSCGILNHHTQNTYHKHVTKAPFDVVIVPGLPYDTANLNPLLKARMLWAKELYENGIARHIIFSGSAVHSPYVEALVMKIMADSMGIPTQHTFIEDKALHSHENIAYGVKKALGMGFKNIAIATDPIQSFMARKYIRLYHSHVSLLPFSVSAMAGYYKAQFPKVDACDAYVEDFVPLRERQAELLQPAPVSITD